MHRHLLVLLAAVIGATLYSIPALACDTCGCRDKGAKSGCECCSGEEQNEAQRSADTHAEAAPDHHAEMAMADDHIKSPADLNVTMREIEPLTVAYVEGTFGGDIEGLFGSLMAAVSSQGLFSDHTHVLSVYQGSLETGPTEETPFQAGVSVENGTQVSEPLMLQTLPGGQYMVVEHWGAYEQITDTYMRVLSWAEDSGIEFRSSPCFEVYVTDPETAPEEEWLTEIFLPFDHNV